MLPLRSQQSGGYAGGQGKVHGHALDSQQCRGSGQEKQAPPDAASAGCGELSQAKCPQADEEPADDDVGRIDPRGIAGSKKAGESGHEDAAVAQSRRVNEGLIMAMQERIVRDQLIELAIVPETGVKGVFVLLD